MSTKKSPTKKTQKQQPESPAPQEQAPSLETPLPQEPAPEPETPPTIPITLESLHYEIESLKSTIAELQEALARKRRPVASNGKVQILDKQTGAVYPSKNNAYQSLLKSGELKELVDKGVFGDVPEKNTFGWYVLAREWPERFEEVPQEKQS